MVFILPRGNGADVSPSVCHEQADGPRMDRPHAGPLLRQGLPSSAYWLLSEGKGGDTLNRGIWEGKCPKGGGGARSQKTMAQAESPERLWPWLQEVLPWERPDASRKGLHRTTKGRLGLPAPNAPQSPSIGPSPPGSGLRPRSPDRPLPRRPSQTLGPHICAN